MLLVMVQVPQLGKSKVKLTLQAPPQVLLLVSASQVPSVPFPSSGKVPDAAEVSCGELSIPGPEVPENSQYLFPRNWAKSKYLPPVSGEGLQVSVELIR
jgi:hypothetical protein